MLKSYLKIALRGLRKHKGYTLINILGLATGMACCLFIQFFIRDELSYDRYHENAERIYRLAVGFEFSEGSGFINSLSSAPMAPVLAADYPEVEHVARIQPAPQSIMVAREENQFYENRFFYADSSVFDVFTFPLIQGDAQTALTQPGTVVISETVAQKYFGEEEPLGKVLTVDGEQDFRVTGVMADVPENSHLHFDFLASFSSLRPELGDLLDDWFYNPFYTYVLVRSGQDVNELNQKVGRMHEPYIGEQLAGGPLQLRPVLQPLTEIHLRPSVNEHEAQGDATYVYVFSVIALFILLIACFNFINLSTARSATRAREVGLRKVVGAGRGQLIRQFLGESLLYALLSAVLAVMLVEALAPLFITVTGKSLPEDYLLDPLTMGSLAVIVLVVGFVAGSYPALVLSSFRPISALKGTTRATVAGFWSRRVLVVLQFGISTALIICTVIAYSQLEYMRTKKLGLNEKQVVVIPVRDERVLRQQETFKAALRQVPSVKSVAFSSRPPGTGAWGTQAIRPDQPDLDNFEMKFIQVDPGFMETLEIELAAGRFFSPDVVSDTSAAVVLNETATRFLGWASPEEAVGQTIHAFGGDFEPTIIGVVRDFHFQPLRIDMQALMLLQQPDDHRYALVRIAPTDIPGTLSAIQSAWSRFSPWPLTYSFLDEDFEALYRAEQRLGRVMAVFGGLAILIACLGLFGLAAFAAEQRTKEISVRKVLGASVSGIVALLSKDFLKLVILAALIGAPVAYVGMSRWLDDFAYRIEIGPGVFLLAGGAALVIALATVSYQAVKAALADPVKSLRCE